MIVVTGGAGFLGRAPGGGLHRPGAGDIPIVGRRPAKEKGGKPVGPGFSEFLGKTGFAIVRLREASGKT